MQITKKHVLSLIDNSFPDKPVPPLSHDGHKENSEYSRVEKICAGRSWRELNSLTAAKDWGSAMFGEALFYMNDAAFMYYLPAFMAMAVEPEEHELRDCVFIALGTPQDIVEGTGSLHPCSSRFAAPQKTAIACFLTYCQQEWPSDGYIGINDWLLATYWHQFASPEADNN